MKFLLNKKILTVFIALFIGFSGATVLAENGDQSKDTEVTTQKTTQEDGSLKGLFQVFADVFEKFKLFIYIGAGFALVFLAVTALKEGQLEWTKLFWFALGLVLIIIAGMIVQGIVLSTYESTGSTPQNITKLLQTAF
jgi:hypothetical protein